MTGTSEATRARSREAEYEFSRVDGAVDPCEAACGVESPKSD